eukprot:TRINITY_DN7445_c1_g2_i1.p2 TRINITY_DN7445_c1_g2~~TRINITY_DN7445_c1_g2_i1.p2  ORF type:complete len:189 (+),score=24.53 TRINITY_DN7445_c1_g2_i1:83-649(+)
MARPSDNAQQQQQGLRQGAPQQTMWDTFFRDAHEDMQRQFDAVQQPQGGPQQRNRSTAPPFPLAQAGPPQPNAPPPAPLGGEGDGGGWGADADWGYANWGCVAPPWYKGRGKGRGRGFNGTHADPGTYGSWAGSGRGWHADGGAARVNVDSGNREAGGRGAARTAPQAGGRASGLTARPAAAAAAARR